MKVVVLCVRTAAILSVGRGRSSASVYHNYQFLRCLRIAVGCIE
jgi:hypothetical protein